MNTAPNTLAPDASQPQGSGAQPWTPGLTDGLGERLMLFDNASQSSVELLRFKREFSDAPGFEDVLRKRVDDLARFKHPAVAPVRGIQTLDNGEGLALVSSNTPGRRLSEMVQVAKGAPFAMDLIQQLAPALSALHQLGPTFAHGTLTADRIVITRDGKLVVVEHVLASAFEMLRLPAARLRGEIGIAVPAGPGPFGLNQRGDVVQLGFIALSLLLGRRLDPAHFPSSIPTLLDEFASLDAPACARLRGWLERALQLTEHPFTTAQEAEAGFNQPAVARTAVPAPRETPPAPVAAEPEKARAVIAFPAPEPFAPAPAPPVAPPAAPVASKPKDEFASRPIGVYSPEEDSKPIRLQEPRGMMAATMHAPVSVTAVASPRVRGGSSSSAIKWIVLALVALGTIGAGLYASGMFGSRETSEPPPVQPSRYVQTSPVPVDPVTPASATPERPSPAPEVQTAPPVTSGPPVTSAPAPLTGTASEPPAGTASSASGSTPASTSGAASGGIAAATSGFGAVRVSSAIDLRVFENGVPIGSTGANVALVEGPHTLELVNEALGFRVRSTVTVRPGQLTPLSIALPNGRVSINAVPWADVFIDGRPAGQTPLANVLVPIGSHEFVFRHPQFPEQKQTVLVKADGMTRVSVTFQQ